MLVYAYFYAILVLLSSVKFLIPVPTLKDLLGSYEIQNFLPHCPQKKYCSLRFSGVNLDLIALIH